MEFFNFIANHSRQTSLKAGDCVFNQGDVEYNFYFVKSGMLKASYVSADGKEFVKSFFVENDFIGNLGSAHMNKPCSFSLICISDCELFSIPFSLLQDRSKDDIKLANLLIEKLIQLAIKKEQREFEFLCLTAEERFSKLLQTSPDLINKITQNDLAKYLGITAVGLSRIKKRVSVKSL